MKYLLDVNALVAAIVQTHVHHAQADDWLQKKELVLCPISELGFLRISTHPRALNLAMAVVRQALESFKRINHVEFVPADLEALKAHAQTSGQVTDSYLAELAAAKGLKLATFDAGIKHRAVELIA
jgi:predicted nucleic acid-binding protein